MKTSVLPFICLCFSICFTSCSDKEKKTSEEKNREAKRFISDTRSTLRGIKTKTEILKLTAELGQLQTLEGFDYTYSFQFQELLEQNNRVLFTDFAINDIVKLDTNFLVSIVLGNLYFTLIATKAQLHWILTEDRLHIPKLKDENSILWGILSQEYNNYRSPMSKESDVNFIIVADLADVRRIKYGLIQDVKECGEEPGYSDPNDLFMNNVPYGYFLFKGKIVGLFDKRK